VAALAAGSLPCAAEPAKPTGAGEPEVKHTVIEDRGARIDELRVRGEVQRITVTTRLGGRSNYQINTGAGSRDFSAGADDSRGSAGKSAWNVLSF
jgi:hypothetical protein